MKKSKNFINGIPNWLMLLGGGIIFYLYKISKAATQPTATAEVLPQLAEASIFPSISSILALPTSVIPTSVTPEIIPQAVQEISPTPTLPSISAVLALPSSAISLPISVVIPQKVPEVTTIPEVAARITANIAYYGSLKAYADAIMSRIISGRESGDYEAEGAFRQMYPDLFQTVTSALTLSGPYGSKTNPVKINRPTDYVVNGFIPENAQDIMGKVVLTQGTKIYFVVDPIAIGVPSGLPFKVIIAFYSGAGNICTLTQNRVTGTFSAESCFGSDAYGKVIFNPNPNLRYLYAIDNTHAGGTVAYDIAAIMPF